MFGQMIACCKEIQDYLDSHEDNVVAIQCKAGKGRTGVIVCACLLNQFSQMTATDALEYYGKHRTTNGKGVTIPSQIRFIYYFSHYLRKELKYESISLKLNYLVLDEMPNIPTNGYELQFVIYVYDSCTKKLKPVYTSRFYEAKKENTRALKLYSETDIIVSDDLKFQFILKSKFGKKENLCHCWLNTFFLVHKPPIQSFVDGFKDLHSHSNDDKMSSTRKLSRFRSDVTDKPKTLLRDLPVDPELPVANVQSQNEQQLYKLTLQKHEIDKANKDLNHKTFPFNFAITFVFQNTLVSTAHVLVPPRIKPRCKNTSEKSKPAPIVLSFKESKQCDYDQTRTLHSPNNSDNPDDDHSESSESSTKNSNSDVE